MSQMTNDASRVLESLSSSRLFKMTVQQGRRRSKNRRRYRPHFVGPFAHTMDLGERKNPSSTSALRESQSDVEDSCELRTKPGKRRVPG